MIRARHILSLLTLLLLGAMACETEIPPGTDFAGTWTCTEQSSLFGQQSFQVQISKDLVIEGQVQVANFYNLGFGDEAVMQINGSSVVIPFQVLSGHDISGDGKVTNVNRIELDYVVSDGIDADTVQAVLQR